MKKKEKKSNDFSSYELDVDEANFPRKIKKESGKYKGKFHFKFFNCGIVGHFVVKFPYAKNESSDNEEDYNIKRKQDQHKNIQKQDKHEKRKNSYKQKRSLYSKGVNDSSKESSESIFESDRDKLSLWKSNKY
jgi:hypothetical protein